MTYIFAFLAGLLTLFNPCVLPVLPIVLAAALAAGRAGPVALVAGMSASFVSLGVLVTAFGAAIGLTQDVVSTVSAVLLALFGALMLMPRAGAAFELATAGMAARGDASIARLDSRALTGQALGGALLGAVWSPCIGPTLGGAIALASQRQDLGHAAGVMTAFALGVSTLMLAVAYGARGALGSGRLHRLATLSRPVLGAAFLVTGLALLAGLDHLVEGWALRVLPPWLTDLSVRY